jgi:hypothetical protein
MLEREFLPEGGLSSNPFLHMGMHVAKHEYPQANRPAEIRALYRQLLVQPDSAHDLEHRLMACLWEILWRARRTRILSDQRAYLDCLRGIA